MNGHVRGRSVVRVGGRIACAAVVPVALAGALACFAPPAHAQPRSDVLSQPHIGHLQGVFSTLGAGDDQLGTSIAIGPDAMIAGAPLDDIPQADRGSMNVFFFIPPFGPWVFVQNLTSPDGAAGDNFGWSVAMSGDTAVIGAPRDDIVGDDSGSAYIFGRSGPGNDWVFVKKIVASDPAAGDEFGYSVAIDGDHALVGAWLDDSPAVGRGSAYVYRRNAGGANNWGFVRKIVAPGGAADDRFGCAVDIDGDEAVVGALKDDDDGPESGSAHVFGRNVGGNNNWGLVKKLVDPEGDPGNLFGTAVAIDEGAVVVGSPADNDLGVERGTAQVFMRNKGGAENWGFAARIADTLNGADGDHLGTSVAVERGVAMVGAPADAVEIGRVLLCQRDAGGPDAWGSPRSLFPLDEDSPWGDRFGASVALGGPWAAVGVPFDDTVGFTIEDLGSADVFEDMRACGIFYADCDESLLQDSIELTLGLVVDCNDNGRPDECDVASGDSPDANMNGVPDECEDSCAVDINGDGVVDSADLGLLLVGFGTMCAP